MADDIYAAAAGKGNIDPLLLRAVGMVESNANSRAVSPKGARGTMQFMPATAAEYGVKDPHDDAQALPAAAVKLNDLLVQHGDINKALMGYNGGHPSRWNNPETQAFPGKVAAAYERLKRGEAVAKPDDLSYILNLPSKQPNATPDDGSASAPEDDISHILNLPTKGKSLADMTDEELKSRGYSVLRNSDNSPVARSLNKPVETNRVPGAATQAGVSMATDPEQQRRIMAGQLFPGMPLNEALSRITYGADGRMVAIGADDRPFYVTPQTPSYSPLSPYGGNLYDAGKALFATPGNASRVAAGLAGPALPMGGGIAGGMVAAPTSLALGPTGAAIGAGAGDALRQGIANRLDPGSQPYNYEQTAREALLSGGGQLAGGMVARGLAPNALMVPGAEVRLARTGSILPDARAAYATAQAQGVDLSAGQASGLSSLLGYEDFAKNNPAFTDAATAFYRQQGQQMQAAGGRMLDSISPVADKTDAAMRFQAGAEDAIRGVRQQANAQARPSYQAAERGGQVMSPDLAQLADVPAVRAALDAARADYANLYRRPAPDTPDFNLWNLAKQKLDDMHGIASLAGERTTAMSVDGLRKDLLSNLDAAYPTYGQARATAAPGQQLAARLEQTATGKIANKTGDEMARPLVSPMFERTNPQGIATARDAFLKSGQGEAWYSGVRAYVQDAIEKASLSQEGLNAAKLRRDVWGKTDIRANLRAAMTPTQFRGFENFIETVEHVAKTYPMNSLTALRQNAGGALGEAASNQPANKLVRSIGAVTSPQTYFAGGQAISAPVDKWLTGRNVQSVIGGLFSPDGMKMLEDMARVSPTSTRGATAALQILSRGAPEIPAADAGPSLSAPRLGNRLMQLAP